MNYAQTVWRRTAAFVVMLLCVVLAIGLSPLILIALLLGWFEG